MNSVHVEASHESISTLDEPVLDTLLRDVKSVGRKLLVVLCPPLGDERELRDWDLWGPLFLCLFLASVLSATAGTNQASIVFSAVFLLVWVGGMAVTLNAQLLGSKISLFQTLCGLGYCLAPLCLGALLCLVIPFFFLNLVIVVGVWGWACWAALRFFRYTAAEERELLVLYPVALFYLFFSWMILVGV